MGFNRKDLEDDDDFDFGGDDKSFDFGDEGDDSSFDFGDEPADIGLDDDDAGFGFEEQDMPDIDEEEEGGGGGVSRTFIIIAAIMILLFLCGLGAVFLISLNSNQKTPFELTSDAIVAINSTTAANALLTETAKAIDAATQTAVALTTQVTITGVTEGETVDSDRDITVIVTGQPQTPISDVIFSIDGQQIGSVAQPPYSSHLDVLALGPGQHSLLVEAVNSAGEKTSANLDFVISEGASLTATARVPTITPTPSPDQTQAAANAILTQQAADLTATASFLLTPRAPGVIGGIGVLIERRQGTTGGIGVQVERNGQGDIVLTPIEGGPASQAGVQAGDILTAVNGTPIDPTMPVETVDQMLQGEVREGNGVSLTIRKPDGSEETIFVPFAGQNDIVLTPIEGGTAIQAGVQAGDILTAVNGTPIDPNASIDQISQMLQGEVREGNGVSLTLRRPDGSEITIFVPFAVTSGFGPADVALTATALAILLAPSTQVAGVPTQEAVTTPGVLPTQLPQTGFFDDLAAGNANVGLIALMALGLVGVIVISRRVRTATNK